MVAKSWHFGPLVCLQKITVSRVGSHGLWSGKKESLVRSLTFFVKILLRKLVLLVTQRA